MGSRKWSILAPNYDPYDFFTLEESHAKIPEVLQKAISERIVTPVLITQGSIYPDGRIQSMLIKGIIPEQKVVAIPSIELNIESEAMPAGRQEIPVVIGRRMAKNCKLKKGDVTTIRWRDVNGTFDAAEVKIVKIFNCNVPNVDVGQMYIHIDILRKLMQAPDEATYLELDYMKGDIVAINGEKMSPATVMETLNKVGGENGIGRVDMVEHRYVGMKARGCYETPAGTIMLKAHRAMESITLDREAAHLKDEIMPKYASLIYNGYWWSPERELLQGMIDDSQLTVNGKVRVKLYKGNVFCVGRSSETDSLFDESIATFEDDEGAYNQKDAEGFIKLNALRMRIAAKKNQKIS